MANTCTNQPEMKTRATRLREKINRTLAKHDKHGRLRLDISTTNYHLEVAIEFSVIRLIMFGRVDEWRLLLSEYEN